MRRPWAALGRRATGIIIIIIIIIIISLVLGLERCIKNLACQIGFKF
jgi:hypothetical protein